MSRVPVVLLIATLDTKMEESAYIKNAVESHGCRALIMDTGMLNGTDFAADISRGDVAKSGGIPLDELLAKKDKGTGIRTMMSGAAKLAKKYFEEGRFDGVIAIGGAQGSDIGTCAMRELPFGVPKFMVSTVASGRATFGPYVGTKDIIMMHSVADIQGINFLTRTVFDNAAAAVCGMIKEARPKEAARDRPAVAMSMLGTTTPGAMRAYKLLLDRGYDAVAFHQNGTGGIAMEDLIREGRFKAVLDINLHEVGDSVAGGLHGSIRDYRLKTAAALGVPQVLVPGSINYAVWGPEAALSPELKARKYIVHNPQLTLVRLSRDELLTTAKIVAERVSLSTGPVHVYIPLKGLSFPDREGGPHWDPEANEVFFKALKKSMDSKIPYDEVNLHVNDPEFIDIAVNGLLDMIRVKSGS